MKATDMNNDANDICVDEYKLDCTYILWYHDKNNKDWSIESYIKIGSISSIKEFWQIYNLIEDVSEGMFFLMRENIAPIWEDDANINGGTWSYKISKKMIHNIWVELSCALIGNSLTKKINNKDIITGISVSPKVYNSILKIWNNDSKYEVSGDYLCKLNKLDTSKSMYKKHKQ